MRELSTSLSRLISARNAFRVIELIFTCTSLHASQERIDALSLELLMQVPHGGLPLRHRCQTAGCDTPVMTQPERMWCIPIVSTCSRATASLATSRRTSSGHVALLAVLRRIRYWLGNTAWCHREIGFLQVEVVQIQLGSPAK